MGNHNRSFFALLSILLILLISFNGASIFSVYIPLPEIVAGDSRNWVSVTSSFANLMYAVEEENPSVILNTQFKSDENTVAVAGDGTRFFAGDDPPVISNTHLPLFRKSHSLPLKEENPAVISNTQLKSDENKVAGAGDGTRFIAGEDPPPVISNTHLPLFRKSHSLPLKEEENPAVISNTQLKSDENTVAGAGDGTRFVARENRPVILNTHLPLFRKSHSLPLEEEKNPAVISNTQLKSDENKVAGAGDAPRFLAGESPPVISNTHLPLLHKSHNLPLESQNFPAKNKKILQALTFMESSDELRQGEFRAKVKNFFSKNESSCKVRFFMTWISSLNSFTLKEFHSIESLFNTHPKGCLLIVSNSMDSDKGKQILKPFLKKGFRVTAISPDLKYLFKNTMAEPWFSKLINGELNVGYVPLGQNLSNLVRLCLLYKFGGVYLDTDVLILKSFSKLKNSIGAQTLDLDSKNWSRLNNAVMVFDKMHPLIYKFIEEFALTFNGNKWGHNGPYLVSRVVSRVQGRPGYNFTILPPVAFYPVNWNRVRNLFRGAKNETDAKWLRGKFRQIQSQSYAVHLWNKQSRRLQVKEGSIVGKILSSRCVFCNSLTMNSIVRI